MTSVEIKKSDRDGKKLMAIFTEEDGMTTKTVHFGMTGYEDYISYYKQSPQLARQKKYAYLARHQLNSENWNDYETAGSLARYILWNRSTLETSINDFRRKFKLT